MRSTMMASILLAMAVTSAQAQITVTRGEYAAGVLVVQGETPHRRARITLDGRYADWTDRDGNFRFRIRYMPRDCTVELKVNTDVRTAYIANCEPAGAPPPRKPR